MIFNHPKAILVFSAFLTFLAGAALADPVTIDVHADRVLHTITPYLTGACIEDVNHEIYGGLYSQMIFGESFQEPPPAPTIKGFKSFGGSWSVRDGAIHIDAGEGPKLISDRAALNDGVVGVEVYFASKTGQNAGLVVRVDRPGIGADRFAGYEVSLDPARQIARLARHRNNFQLVEDAACEVPVGQWIALEVTLDGSTVSVRVDGKQILRHDDQAESLRSGPVGLRAWHQRAAFRNFRVRAGQRTEQLPFEQTDATPHLSSMWRPVTQGSAAGRFAFVTDHPFAGSQSQQITFESGEGEFGIANQGLNHWGMNFVAGKSYEGYVWARAEKPVTLLAKLESSDGSQRLAEQSLNIRAGDWQRLDVSLTPSSGDISGRFTLSLEQPGSVILGHTFLQPGDWGRFKGLPVRRDVADAMIAQGITVLRYGGSMVNHASYKWKNMIGPRDRRPPYAGTWYAYSSNGWAIPEFMNFCEAAGFEYIPAFHMGESLRDMADFIDYAKSDPQGPWGRKRVLDGHAQPYRIHYLELGNEERVDDSYAQKFEALAIAIWAKDPKMILVVGDFAYSQPIADPFHFTGAASRITTLAAHQRILQFAKQHDGEVWFDVHLDTDHPVPSNNSLKGMFSFADALTKIADGARHRVVVFELNAGNHAQRRALANALAINAIERDGRIPIVASANGLQPDRQNDNGWDQGLLFLNPSQVWLQPPGYVTQTLAKNYQPRILQCDVTGVGESLDVTATQSDDGKTLVLQVVNPANQSVQAAIHLTGFTPARTEAEISELAGEMDAVNTAQQPNHVTPRTFRWPHGLNSGQSTYTFQPHALTVIRIE